MWFNLLTGIKFARIYSPADTPGRDGLYRCAPEVGVLEAILGSLTPPHAVIVYDFILSSGGIWFWSNPCIIFVSDLY